MYNNIQKILAFYLEAPRSSSRRTFVSFLNRLESNNVGCTGIVMLKGGCRCCCCEPATRSNSHSCSLILQHPKCTVHFLFGRWGFHFSFESARMANRVFNKTLNQFYFYKTTNYAFLIKGYINLLNFILLAKFSNLFDTTRYVENFSKIEPLGGADIVRIKSVL